MFFDYNEASIRDDSRAALQKNVDWLRRWANTKISVEGHCDERGSSEYNLALGERRATAFKDISSASLAFRQIRGPAVE